MNLQHRRFKNGKNCRFNRKEIWKVNCRCCNIKSKDYKNYGGRGISIYNEWLDPMTGFAKFIEYMGPRPSNKHSIDRFPNNNGNYEPRNVRWAASSEQNYNKRKYKAIENFSDEEILKECLRRGIINET